MDGVLHVEAARHPAAEVPGVIERLVETYVANRRAGERFVDTVHRLGLGPFKIAVYGATRELAHA